MKAEADRMRVLVVEDNPDGARVLAMLLRRCGYEAAVANDGPDALRQAAESPPDVVLLDIGLPGMDGWQVARRLRQMDGLQETFLVALTAYSGEADYRRSEEEGIHFHFVKPLKPDVLKLVLDRLRRSVGPGPVAAAEEHEVRADR